MGNIYVNTCSDTEEGQKWVVMTDGRIALESSKPRKHFKLDSRYLRANPIQRSASISST